MGDKDVDAQFADIIAHWDDVAVLPDRPTPDRPTPDRGAADGRDTGQPARGLADTEPHDLGTDHREGRDGDEPAGRGGTRPGVNPPLHPEGNPTNPPPIRPFVVWRGVERDDEDEPDPVELTDGLDDEDHFEPGPVAPLPPQEDLQFWGIIVGLVVGPLLLLWLVLFRPDVSGWWTLGALGLTVGGFVLLVLRQPHSRDEDDPDNGARV